MAVRKLAGDANWPMRRVNFGAGIEKEQLLGHYAPKENAEDGVVQKVESVEDDLGCSRSEAIQLVSGAQSNFEWKDGILTDCVRNGKWFLGDEINAAPPEATVALNGLLEDAENASLELVEKGEVVEPHPRFKFVATMNPPHHKGVKRLNRAFSDRFYRLPVKRLSRDKEVELLMNKTSMDNSDASSLVTAANDIRDSYQDGQSASTVTTRDLIKVGRKAEVVGMEEAISQEIIDRAERGDRDAIEDALDILMA